MKNTIKEISFNQEELYYIVLLIKKDLENCGRIEDISYWIGLYDRLEKEMMNWG